MRRFLPALSLLLAVGRAAAQAPAAPAPTPSAPLVMGETFTVPSRVLGETRRINVYRPPAPDRVPLPVLYMPDGGMAEDFLHIAGLVQVSVGNGTMRPFLLVGIENTERRRDLTGPTRVARDSAIAPRVGGSAAFRAFLRDELMPEIRRRYRTTGERAIVGESLAGLFVVETLLLEPTLFDTYVAMDPSLWWNDRALVRDAPARLRSLSAAPRTLWIATSVEASTLEPTRALGAAIARAARPALRFHHEPMPEEGHGTIFHPAALRAFRGVLGEAKSGGGGGR